MQDNIEDLEACTAATDKHLSELEAPLSDFKEGPGGDLKKLCAE